MENGNSRVLFIIDLIIIFVSFFIVFTYYRGDSVIPLKGNILMGLIVIYWFLISVNSEVLRINRLSTHLKVIKDALIAYSVLSTTTIATVAIFGEFRPNDKLVLYPLLYGVIFSTVSRLFYLFTIKHVIKYGYPRKSILVIGSGRMARQIISKIVSTPELGFQIQGILSNSPPEPFLRELYRGGLDKFESFLHYHSIDEVIIAKPLSEEKSIRHIFDRCEKAGVRFYIVPDVFDIIPKWTVLHGLGDIPVIAVRNEPLNIFSNRLIKRAFDIAVSFFGLLILSPVLLIIAASVKLSSPGPVLFRQKRIGNNNLEFTLYKFRSMTVQPQTVSDTTWTLPNDRRVTSVGRILRRTNLDELPQLWNVLVGDMSIVGPRPERGHFVEKFSMEIPNYRIRHLVKSGITGLAQANGWRGNTCIQKRVESDLYYLEHWSLWLDLKIIFLTFFNRAAWKNAI